MRKIFFPSFFFLSSVLVSILSSSMSMAVTNLKITSGGLGSSKAFERIKPEVEAATKSLIELSIYKQTVAMQSLVNGKIDGVTLTNPELLVAENSEDFKGIDINSLIWQQFYEGYVLFLTHKSNKISNITSEQVTDILTGKITNWKALGGSDQAIAIFSAESLIGANKSIAETYLKQKKLPFKANVVDHIGLSKAVLNDKGGFGIASGRLPKTEFDIQYIKSDAKISFSLAALKKGNPVMLEIIEFLKKKPLLKDE
jgi:PBP superfamily domain